jgi:Bacterial Ig-like domain (group 3)
MKTILAVLLLAFAGALHAQTANATVTVTITAAPAVAATNATPTATPNTGTTKTAIVVAGSVTGSNNGASPTGSIAVYLGTTSIGTGTLAANGTYSCSITGLPVGTDQLIVVYSGDANFSAGVAP